MAVDRELKTCDNKNIGSNNSLHNPNYNVLSHMEGNTLALQYISVVPVYVSDQDQAIDFFAGKLGFTKTEDDEFAPGQRWVMLATPDGKTAITLSKASDFGMESMLGKHTGLVFHSDDVRGSVEHLRANGVKITEDPNEQMWGVQAQFQDVDGNSYVIVGK